MAYGKELAAAYKKIDELEKALSASSDAGIYRLNKLWEKAHDKSVEAEREKKLATNKWDAHCRRMEHKIHKWYCEELVRLSRAR